MNEAIRNLVTFRVGIQWYGIDVEKVIEISHMVLLSEVPTSSPDVIGLMTLRNVVMPVIDLRLRFGVGETQYRMDTPIIALRAAEGPKGIVVDEIDNVEHITVEQSSTELGEAFPYISGTAQIHDRLLMLLNMNALDVANGVPKLPKPREG
jgi:purine-binding chemotaxis protein CheW